MENMNNENNSKLNNQEVIEPTNVRENFDNYSVWLKTLSWGKFILFSILTLMITGLVENLFITTSDNGFLGTMANIFVLISFGIKILRIENKK